METSQSKFVPTRYAFPTTSLSVQPTAPVQRAGIGLQEDITLNLSLNRRSTYRVLIIYPTDKGLKFAVLMVGKYTASWSKGPQGPRDPEVPEPGQI